MIIPYDLMEDAIVTMRQHLPRRFVESGSPLEWYKKQFAFTIHPNGPGNYTVILLNNERLEFTKTTQWRSHWRVKFRNVTYDTTYIHSGNLLTRAVLEAMLTPLEQYEELLSTMDWYYEYSDDHSVWQGGVAHTKRMKELQAVLIMEGHRGEVEALDKKYYEKGWRSL
jgi:hypothetical protein